MGVEELKKYIKDKVESQVEELLRRARLVRERELSQAKVQLEQWKEAKMREFIHEKIALVARYKAKAYKEMTLALSQTKEEIWQDFYPRLRRALVELKSDQGKYSQILLRLLNNGITTCQSEVVIKIHSEDVELLQRVLEAHYKDCRSQILPDDSIEFGLIVLQPQSGISIRLDLDAILEANAGWIKRELFNQLAEENG